MTKIVEIAGLQRPVQIPERPWFPLSQMTEGELQLATKIRELEMIEAINRSAGRVREADEQAGVLNELNRVLKSGLHSGGIGMAKMPKLRRYWQKLTRMDRPCYLSHTNISGGFEPTDEQEQYCRQQARNYANGRAAGAGYKGWNGQGAVPEFTLRNIPTGSAPSNDRFPYRQKYQEKLNSCLEKTELENVVNAHLIDAGPNFLYDQMGPGNYNNLITVKYINQQSWIFTASEVTGLSETNVRNIARLGTIEKMTGKGYGDLSTPEALKSELYPYMQPGSIGGNSIGALGIFDIIEIVMAVVDLVMKGIRFVLGFKEASRAQQAFENIPSANSPNFQIRQEDFLIETDQDGNPTPPAGGGGGGPDLNTSNLFGGLMSDPLNIALIAAAGFLIFQPQLMAPKNQA
jgi:hypothetical protein